MPRYAIRSKAQPVHTHPNDLKVTIMGKTKAKTSIDGDQIEEIVRRVRSVCQPDKIILFGSAATGEMTPDSDIDILIVERNPEDPLRESTRVDEALGGLDYPFDVIVIERDWFEASKNVIGGIAYPANKYGRVIYDAA
jgi:predicted nucleotidyltransferase